MDKFFDFFSKLYKNSVVFFTRIILVFLFIIALTSTCKLPSDISEETFFVGDNLLLNFLVLIVGIFILMFLKKKGVIGKIPVETKGFMLAAIFAIVLGWLIMSRYTPRSDQMAVCACLNAIKNGDFANFEKGGYFSKYPYQMGIVFLYYIWASVFGIRNVLALQVLNGLAVVFFYKKLGDLCVHQGLPERYRNYIYLIGILFYPLMMYSSFIYGNLLGLAFSVAAIDYEVIFFKENKKRYMFLSVLFILLGIYAKKNYEIFLIAMFIFAFFELYKSKKIQQVAYLVMLVIVLLANSLVIDSITYKMTGIKNEGAMSSWSYVAIGLMEGPRANGWHNDFEAYSYEESGFDADGQKELAFNNIRWMLGRFLREPGFAKEFFVLKLASQWNNPTFECHWINQVCDYDGEQSDLTKIINSDDASDVEYAYLDVIMLFVLLGAMAAFWLKDEFGFTELILATTFVGGFLFHIVWEAKGQYTLSYYVLLFPYAISGLIMLTEKMALFGNAIFGRQSIIINRRRAILFGITFVFIILLIGGDFATLTRDTTRWLSR